MLTLTELRKSYGRVLAVDSLSLQIHRGEVFGLLGPNGAGKSTTIGMSVGLIHPDSGEVLLEGVGKPTSTQVRKHIGVAPQSLALYDDMTGEENLRFFGRLYSMDKRTLRERVAATLDMVGLEARKKDRVGGYSGGMKRRLNLAVAMIHDPPMLLLDEPTAGVDPQSRNNILDLVRELATKGRTIVYTTHYMEEASRLCDRIAIMDKGKILALGQVRDLVAKYGGASTVTIVRDEGEERIVTADPVKEIARVMSEAQGIRGVRIDRPDLESVFLTLTGRSLRD